MKELLKNSMNLVQGGLTVKAETTTNEIAEQTNELAFFQSPATALLTSEFAKRFKEFTGCLNLAEEQSFVIEQKGTDFVFILPENFDFNDAQMVAFRLDTL